MTQQIDVDLYTVEELANALYRKCESLGIEKGTDKTKWREAVVAEKLGHQVHNKISAGKGSKEYGSDAFNEILSRFEEYKTKALVDKELRNLFEEPKGTNGHYAPLVVSGVYNGYNSNYEEASVEYPKKGHYFALFYKEKCVLIIQVDTNHVMKTLNENYDKWVYNGKKGTSNLNTVSINLGSDKHLYTVAYKDYEFFNQKH
jgi:hypothetical protein